MLPAESTATARAPGWPLNPLFDALEEGSKVCAHTRLPAVSYLRTIQVPSVVTPVPTTWPTAMIAPVASTATPWRLPESSLAHRLVPAPVHRSRCQVPAPLLAFAPIPSTTLP